MVATNAAGSRAFRFGATRDWVEELTVELASGRTLELRRGADTAEGDTLTLVDGTTRVAHLPAIPKPHTKNSIGYGFTPGGDVLDLFIGSEGTLGVVTEVTLRLAPSTEPRLAFLQCFATPAQAFALVEALRADRALRTTAIEFLDTRSHELARETGKPEVERVLANAPPKSCSVFAEFGYDDDAGLEATIERVLAHVAAAGGDEAAGLAGIEDQVLRDIRVFRHAVPERINATIAQRRLQHPTLHKIATDMAVEDKDLTWVYDLYTTRLTEAGLDHAVFGHAGNNHFHVNILPKDDAELVRAKAIYAEFAQAIVARGGCVSAEHGIGRIKKHFLPVQYDAATLDTMRAAKRWLDPRLAPQPRRARRPRLNPEKSGPAQNGVRPHSGGARPRSINRDLAPGRALTFCCLTLPLPAFGRDSCHRRPGTNPALRMAPRPGPAARGDALKIVNSSARRPGCRSASERSGPTRWASSPTCRRVASTSPRTPSCRLVRPCACRCRCRAANPCSSTAA
jgi:FAD/FMN-containing dehydrogenase